MTTGRLDFEAYNCDPDKTTSTPGFRRDVWLAVVARGAAAVRDVRVTITAPDGCVIDSGASGQGPTPNRITVPLFGELTGGEGQGWRLGITAPKSVVVPSGVVTLQVEVEGTDVATGGSVRRVGTHQVVFPFPDVDLPAAFTVTGTGGNPLVVGVPSTLTVTLTTRKGWVENTLVRAYLPLCLSFGSSKSGGRAVEDGRVVEWDLQRLDHRHDLDFTVSADDDIEPRDVNRVLDVVVTSSDATAGLFQFRPEVSFDPTLDVVVGDPVTVERGSTAKFAFRVADGKGSPAYGTRVSAVLPPGVTFTDATPAPTSTGRTITWELPTVKAGDGEAFTVSGKVAPNAGSELDCRVTADCAAGIGLQDSRQASGTVRVKVEDLARLEFTRHVAVPETVVPGKKGQDDVVYRWTVVNHGPCPAKAVEVDVELPGELTGQHASSGGGRNGANGWRWSVGDLAVAATRDVEAGGVVAAGFSGALVATATAKTATRTDTGPVVSRVTAHSDAQVVLDLPSGYATPAKVLTDSDLTFIWAFAAKGPSTATNVKVTVTLPDGVDLHPGYRDKPEAAPKKVDGNRYEITLGDQAAGATGYVAVVTKVKDTASGTMTATATVTADDLTTAVPPRDLTATVASRQDGGRKQDHSTSWWSAFLAALLGLGALLLTPPVPPSDASGDTTDDDDDEDEDKKKKRTRLRLTGKSSEDEPAAASDVTLTWEVANRGKNYPATALTVDVTVPEGLTITSTSPSDGTATDTGIGAVLWEIPELATDRKATLEIKATVAADPPGSVRVIASASALNAPLTTKSVTVKPRRKAKWELSEGEVKPQPATIGSKAAFSWTVTNRGPSTADKPALVVTVPDGLEDPVVSAGG
ncbi:MAG: hypothetical protein HOV94_00770 [Saccharothrix sp.]|nr:hypothetical protein [Saccharothrix sp.]